MQIWGIAPSTIEGLVTFPTSYTSFYSVTKASLSISGANATDVIICIEKVSLTQAKIYNFGMGAMYMTIGY